MNHTQILVVDDEPEIATSLADYLSKKAGYQVFTANDGQDAMALLEAKATSPAGPVDLVVLDRRMPGVSGLDVLTWIREHPSLSYTRVVMLTGISGSQDKVEALAAGADDYITKPYHPQELLARVNTILRPQRLEKQLQRQGKQLAALNRVSNETTTSLDAGQILTAVVEGVRAVLAAQTGAVFLWEQSQGTLHCRAASGAVSAEGFVRVPAGSGLIGTVFSRQRPLRSSEPHEEEMFRPELDIPAGFSLSSLLARPLVMRGRAIGVLWAANNAGGPFSDTDEDLFASLAGTASRALENASLFQSVRARQQELQESHNRLQAVINGILHPIYTIDSDWRLVAVNRQKEEELEPDSAPLPGRVCYEAFFERETPCDHCQVSRLLDDGQPHHWAVRWLGEDHLPREWEINAYPLPGQQADTPSAVVVWQDRTEERRLESSLMQAGKLAAIGQLAAGVAHEINNPLTAINTNAEILKMFIPPEEDLYESVDLIARAVERASNVVRGLLDFARQNQYSFESGNVNQSILQALHLVSYQLKSADITVARQLDDTLPEIHASWEHLKTVWLNLLVNARDAVVKGNKRGQIEIISRPVPDADEVQIIIRDNGIGMSPAEASHIFEPFYTTKDPGQGTGLGLATSQRIIQQHGGTIEVATEPNEGTTFIVRLPQQTLLR